MPQFTLTKYILRLGVQMSHLHYHKQSEIRASCIFHLKRGTCVSDFSFFYVVCLCDLPPD